MGVGMERLAVHCCASHLHYADKEAGSNGVGFRHTWGSSRTHAPSEQTHPQQAHFKSFLRGGVDAVQRWRVGVFERPSGFGEASRRKQPASLAVEGAEESLSILPDYTATVRPPPKRCLPR